MYDGDEAPSTETPFITIEQSAAEQSQLSGWANTTLTFSVVGKDTEKATLWEIAEEIRDIFQSDEQFTGVGTDAAVAYQMVGEAVFDSGVNPVTENVYVSVAIGFGLVP